MRDELRIGVLTDGDNIPAWSYRMLEKIINSEHSEIVLIVKKGQPVNENVSLFTRVWSKKNEILWILYHY